LAATVLTGGFLAWFASDHPDGLEWSIEKATGSPELESHKQTIYSKLEGVQEKTSLMPDYSFKQTDESHEPPTAEARKGTTVAGLFGGFLVLGLGVLKGIVLKKRNSNA